MMFCLVETTRWRIILRDVALRLALALTAVAFWGCYRETGVEEFPIQGTQLTEDNQARIAQGRDASGRSGDFVILNSNLQIVVNGDFNGANRDLFLPRSGGAIVDIATQFRTAGNQDVRPRDDDGIFQISQGVNLSRGALISYSRAVIEQDGEFEGQLRMTGALYDLDGSLEAAGASVDAATRRVLDCAVSTTIFLDDLTGVQNQDRDPPQYATVTTVLENQGDRPLPIFTINDIVVTGLDTMNVFIPYPDWGFAAPTDAGPAFPHFTLISPNQLNTCHYGFFSLLDGVSMVRRQADAAMRANYTFIGKPAPAENMLEPGGQITYARQFFAYNEGSDAASSATSLRAYDVMIDRIRDSLSTTPIAGHPFNEFGILAFEANVRNSPGGQLTIEMINESVSYFDGTQYRPLEPGRTYPIFGGRPILTDYDVPLPPGQAAIRAQALNSEPFYLDEGVNVRVEVAEDEEPVVTPLLIVNNGVFDLGSDIRTGAIHSDFRLTLEDDDERDLMGRITVERVSAEGPVETGLFPGPRQGSYVLADIPNITSGLPNGEYKLYISHGPLYEMTELDMTIDEDLDDEAVGEVDPSRDFQPTLRRVVSLPNFLSADFDARSYGDPIGQVSDLQMLRFGYAEDLDVVFFSNTGQQSLPRDRYDALALLLGGFNDDDRDANIESLRDELTIARALAVIGKAPDDYPDRGRFTLLNLPDEDREPLLEAPLFGTDPASFYDDARALGENVVVHVTRPRAPRGLETGFFTAIAEMAGLPAGQPIPGDHALYQRTAASGSDTRWIDFDAIQLLSSNRYDEYLLARQDWFNLLNAGIFKPATGGSSRAQTKDIPHGSVRTWVAAQNTLLRDNDLAEFWSSVQAGAMFVSNGPVIVADIGGASYGETASATGGSARAQLRISAAPWIPLRELRAVVNGQVQVLDVPLDQGAVLRFEGEVDIALPDAGPHWIVFELGATLDELAAGAGDTGLFGKINIGHLPLAFTNPIFVNN